MPKFFGDYLLLETGKTDKLLLNDDNSGTLLLATVTGGNRSKSIFSQIQLILAGGIKNLKEVLLQIPEDLIYDLIGDSAMNIAQDTLCLEKLLTVNVTDSEIQEPDGFFRPKLIQISSNLSMQLVELDVEDFDALSRYTFAGTAQTPLYFKRWNGVITLNPTVASGDYPIYYWAIPTTEPSRTVDPETPIYMDNAIVYKCVAELAPIIGKMDLVNLYTKKYENEARSNSVNLGKTKSRMLQLQSHE
jgi:hypothetical protein